ncbi:hypothetical protein TNIN_213161 [Trichonephila inaurata madagascariensis]|uniref:Uncharacterized protein n=1 Tax=Trichonephila inaurata madagascariensis TaxID=2747483 RepID=A0A8X6WPT0_9ARAC|nr:hypothetical protein TNIN_213161 [Trichonephila inaurata madagascariensis]
MVTTTNESPYPFHLRRWDGNIVRGTFPFETLAEPKDFERLHDVSGETGLFVSGLRTGGTRVRGKEPLRAFLVNSRSNPRAGATANVGHMTVWRVGGRRPSTHQSSVFTP